MLLERVEWIFNNPFPLFYTSGNIHYGIEIIRVLLTVCTYSSFFLLLAFAVASNLKTKILFLTLLVFGVGNALGTAVIHQKDFGSLYEMKEYEISYEAYLYSLLDEQPPIFCILTIEHSKGWDIIVERPGLYFYNHYYITDIYLPYGRFYENEYLDFYPGEKNSVSLGTVGAYAEIKLEDVATEQSYKRLADEALSANGEVVASRNGNVYHNENWCSHDDRIKRKNLIRFNSTWEAEILGFDVCQDCNNW